MLHVGESLAKERLDFLETSVGERLQIKRKKMQFPNPTCREATDNNKNVFEEKRRDYPVGGKNCRRFTKEVKLEIRGA